MNQAVSRSPVAAFLISPGVGAAAYGLLMSILYGFEAGIGLAIIGVAFAYLVALGLGVPGFFFLHKLNLLRTTWIVAGAFIISIAAFFCSFWLPVLFMPTRSAVNLLDILSGCSYAAVGALIAGVAFSLILFGRLPRLRNGSAGSGHSPNHPRAVGRNDG